MSWIRLSTSNSLFFLKDNSITSAYLTQMPNFSFLLEFPPYRLNYRSNILIHGTRVRFSQGPMALFLPSLSLSLACDLRKSRQPRLTATYSSGKQLGKEVWPPPVRVRPRGMHVNTARAAATECPFEESERGWDIS